MRRESELNVTGGLGIVDATPFLYGCVPNGLTPAELPVVSKSKRAAFTLVELLIVIGIIAVLIAVLLPTLAAARRAARVTACAANLQQIGVALHLYADANQGYFPWAFIRFKPTATSDFLVVSWDDQCDRALGGSLNDDELLAHSAPRDKPVLRCPADGLPAEWQADPAIATPPPDLHRRSYAMTSIGGAPGGDNRGVLLQGSGGAATWAYMPSWDSLRGRLCVKRSWFNQASEALMVVEQPNSENVQGSRYYADVILPRFRYWGWQQGRDELIAGRYVTFHGTKWNYLFIDGHVSLLASPETVRPFTARPLDGLIDANYMWTRRIDD